MQFKPEAGFTDVQRSSPFQLETGVSGDYVDRCSWSLKCFRNDRDTFRKPVLIRMKSKNLVGQWMNCTTPEQLERQLCFSSTKCLEDRRFKQDSIQAIEIKVQKDSAPHSCKVIYLQAESSCPGEPFLRDSSQSLISDFYQVPSLSRSFLNTTHSYTVMQMSHHILGRILKPQKHKVKKCLSTLLLTKPQAHMTGQVCLLAYTHTGIQVCVCIYVSYYVIQIVYKSPKSNQDVQIPSFHHLNVLPTVQITLFVISSSHSAENVFTWLLLKMSL